MDARSCLAIVLAAGEGTRMRSAMPKALHRIGGRTLLAHVLDTVRRAGSARAAVIVGPGHESVAQEARDALPAAEIFVQAQRRGTAHAVLMAKDAIARGADDVVVIFADTPLVRPETVARLRAALAAGAAVVVAGFRPLDPFGYGRLVVRDGKLVAIREEKDASADERKIGLCNGGLTGLSGRHALSILERIGSDNRQNEFYLTDAVSVAVNIGLDAVAIEVEEDDVRGINTKAQLAEAEAVLQRRLRVAALEAGVTMTAPETVFLCEDTTFGQDVTIEPYVVFGPGVSVGDRAVIHSYCHLAGAEVGEGVSVGPFARLRPGTKLGQGSKVGNFVETKAATVEAGAKLNHLSYVGDARVGEGANIGAGTITCNYDGFAKHHTDIGKGAFVGTNSSLVAPVKIGDGAYIGSGSVITEDVPADALALGRGRQTVKEAWASRLRAARDKGHKT
jgi:bifunctional UDP-N-acetylglucosamine pyrophosphorylase/glucosamine-1-phosphate N-acetyltransferase